MVSPPSLSLLLGETTVLVCKRVLASIDAFAEGEVRGGADAVVISGIGERGREAGAEGWLGGWTMPGFFFCFLREDSLPLASERFGDPGRLMAVMGFLDKSKCLGRPDGVFVPLVELPDGGFSALSLPLLFSAAFRSSSFLRSSSLSLSVSESSERVW